MKRMYFFGKSANLVFIYNVKALHRA